MTEAELRRLEGAYPRDISAIGTQEAVKLFEATQVIHQLIAQIRDLQDLLREAILALIKEGH